MSVKFKKVQNKIDGSKSYGKWYGRAVTLGTVDTTGLAEEISHSTTVTRADIMAVLIELAEAMRRHLLNSQAVKLDGIGTFRVSIQSAGTAKEEDFKANKIKNFRIAFSPVRSSIASISSKDGKAHKVYVKDLLNGVTAEELPSNNSGKASETGKSDESSESSQTGDENQANG